MLLTADGIRNQVIVDDLRDSDVVHVARHWRETKLLGQPDTLNLIININFGIVTDIFNIFIKSMKILLIESL
jgi:hypothetical protein